MHPITSIALRIAEILSHDSIDNNALKQALDEFADVDSVELQIQLAGMQSPPEPIQVVEHPIAGEIVVGGCGGLPQWEGKQYPSYHHLIESVGRDYLSNADWLHYVPWAQVLELLRWAKSEILRESRQLFVEPESPDCPMLSKNAAKVFELLLESPPYAGMTGPEICNQMLEVHRINMDESTLRSRIIPALKPYGIENIPKLGYRILPSKRPKQ